MSKVKLRAEFELESGMTWKDISGSPRIEYTKWLEARANGTSSFQFENNKRRPAQAGTYEVEYSNGEKGFEYFNGAKWIVKYNHPVKYWSKWII
jgi:hypothetical protein